MSVFKDAFAGHLHETRLRTSRIFHNQGNNRFLDVTEKLGLLDTSWTGDATPTDFNNDGWPDIYVLNMQGHDQYWINREGKKNSKIPGEKFLKKLPGVLWV